MILKGYHIIEVRKNFTTGQRCSSDLCGGSKHRRHGNGDRHGLVVEGCALENSKRDKEINKGGIDSLQE